MTTRRGRSRGAALATAMLLTVLLLTLGISFLTFCQRDLQFQRRQQATTQAQLLARAGVEYYRYLENKIPSQRPANNTSIIKPVGPGEEFEVRRAATGLHYTSTGRVKDRSGNVLVERTIFVPNGNVSVSYDRNL